MHLLCLLLTATLPLTPTDLPPCTGTAPECQQLNAWYSEGSAAGLAGDRYDNRDRDHSKLRLDHFPQLVEISYSAQERTKKVDWGGQTQVLPGVVIGNSSTASDPRSHGSNVRGMYYTVPRGVEFLYRQYRFSNLYVYPEHRDHDRGTNGADGGYGDLYPTNTPYVVVSQGSSGSDQPFLRAIAHTLASFQPEVKQKLQEKGLLMPTVQMLMRSTLRSVKSPQDYLSGKSHPSAFNSGDLDVMAMEQAAHQMTIESIPALPLLEIVNEQTEERDNPYFTFAESEALHTTPCAVARIWRGPSHTRTLMVSALKSIDINQHPLKFKWVVLRGDPDKVHIEPTMNGALAEVSVEYQPRHDWAGIQSSRVDIGVFAHNGENWSAPAFLTFYTLDNEVRDYDQEGRLRDILFDAQLPAYALTDPVELCQMLVSASKRARDLLFEYIPSAYHEQIIAWAQDQLDRRDSDGAHITLSDHDPILKRLLKGFDAMAADERLLFQHQGDIEAWVDEDSPHMRQTWYDLLQDLMDLDIVQPPADEQADKVARSLLLEHNIDAMCELLFYRFLRSNTQPLFVDARLSKANPVRYRFEYEGTSDTPAAKITYKRQKNGWEKQRG